MSEDMNQRFVHGGNIYEANPARGEWLDFSANINPLGLSASVRRAIENGIPRLVHYPDPSARALKQAISEHYGVPQEGIVLGKRIRLAIALTGLLACTSFVGCAKREEKVMGIKIGVSVYDTHDAYLSALLSEFNSYITEKAKETGIAMSVEVQNSNGSQATQNNSVEDMIDNGCDVLCVNLVDRTDPTVIIDMAQQKNIPVIFFNRELVEGDIERWSRLYYVGANAEESGTLQGEVVIDAIENNDIDKPLFASHFNIHENRFKSPIFEEKEEM